MDLLTEFERIVATLNEAAIDYALCGGLAVAAHGAPRATRDIDLLVRPEDVDRILETLRPLGFRFKAAPMTFSDGMRMQPVSRVDDGQLLTVDLLLVGPSTREA